jgi:2-oxo-hept-3-ene-1,7-dioate hydratase
MMTDKERRDAVEILLKAERERKAAVQLSKTYPNIEIEDSYAIQRLVNEAKVAAGSRIIGNKIGLTSKAMQASSQIDEPDYGVLHDYMIIEDGAKVPFERFIVPRVEPELVFVLGKPLKGPGVGLLDVLRATEYVVPAIEIIDARVQNPRRIFDTVADNGAAAGLVIGGRAVGPMDVACAGWARCSTATPTSRKAASPPGCWAIPRWPSPGSRTRSGASAIRSSRAA